MKGSLISAMESAPEGRLKAIIQQLDRKGIVSLLQRRVSLAIGRSIHARIVTMGLETDTFLANLLVRMYRHCGSLPEARFLFDKTHHRNIVSWNSMIAAYTQHGHCNQALHLFQNMLTQGIRPDKITFVSVLRACAGLEALTQGRIVHGYVVECGFETDVVVGTALVTMYAKCGALEDAKSAFGKIGQPNVVSWNALITAYTQHGYGHESFHLFRQMQHENVKPNEITFVSVLGACSDPEDLSQGEAIHARVADCELEPNIVLDTALVTMYGRCGALKNAQTVFNRMQRKDIVSWTAMISAYAQHGHGKESLQLFQQMQQEGFKPDKVSLVSALSACANLTDLLEGKKIHACIIKCGFELDAIVSTALVNMYGKCRALKDARSLFDKMHQRNVVSWNAMIAAYSQHDCGKESLQLFRQMLKNGAKPDEVTFIEVLRACASMGAISEGNMIHACIADNGFETDIAVGTALVTMYGKCGAVADARLFFDRMPQRNLISWNAMLGVYGQHGYGKESLQVLREMLQAGVKPNDITFISLLSACSHAGLVNEGRSCFFSMSKDHGITPTLEHYGCMIDLFGRAGRLDEAEDFIRRMPLPPNALLWITLLGACRVRGDVERGRRAAEQAMLLDPQKETPYIMLSNIYAAKERWDGVENVRSLMLERGIKKQLACSWIEVENNVHTFFVGDTSHPSNEAIYVEIESLIKRIEGEGYIPNPKLVLGDVEEELTEQLSHHSEKMAIAFGLISTHPRTPLRIFKNLRVCSDCHTAMKFISKVFERDIIMRDANRFHHFKQGVCSCGDYW